MHRRRLYAVSIPHICRHGSPCHGPSRSPRRPPMPRLLLAAQASRGAASWHNQLELQGNHASLISVLGLLGWLSPALRCGCPSLSAEVICIKTTVLRRVPKRANASQDVVAGQSIVLSTTAQHQSLSKCVKSRCCAAPCLSVQDN